MEENGKAFVVDASYVLAFLLPDEEREGSKDVFIRFIDHEIDFYSIPLLPFEVVNGLRMAIIRKRHDEQTTGKFLEDFLRLRIPLQEVSMEEVFAVSRAEGITVYDAAYLALARQRNAPLLSFDTHLRKFAVS